MQTKEVKQMLPLLLGIAALVAKGTSERTTHDTQGSQGFASSLWFSLLCGTVRLARYTPHEAMMDTPTELVSASGPRLP